jgi:hypothetical protein
MTGLGSQLAITTRLIQLSGFFFACHVNGIKTDLLGLFEKMADWDRVCQGVCSAVQDCRLALHERPAPVRLEGL